LLLVKFLSYHSMLILISWSRLFRALRTDAMNGNVIMIHFETFRSRHDRGIRWQRDIKNFAARIAKIMAMLLHVRAKARRAAFKLHLPDEATLHERIQTIINRRVRNLRHRLFRADENFFRRRMIALLHDHVIDVLALRRETKAAGVQPLAEFAAQFFLDHAHRKGKINMNPSCVKI
jgi:hypothetical protein